MQADTSFDFSISYSSIHYSSSDDEYPPPSPPSLNSAPSLSPSPEALACFAVEASGGAPVRPAKRTSTTRPRQAAPTAATGATGAVQRRHSLTSFPSSRASLKRTFPFSNPLADVFLRSRRANLERACEEKMSWGVVMNSDEEQTSLGSLSSLTRTPSPLSLGSGPAPKVASSATMLAPEEELQPHPPSEDRPKEHQLSISLVERRLGIVGVLSGVRGGK